MLDATGLELALGVVDALEVLTNVAQGLVGPERGLEALGGGHVAGGGFGLGVALDLHHDAIAVVVVLNRG